MSEYLDCVPPGWFALGVMREKERGWNWVALLVDVDPIDLKNCQCDFPALLYVHPKDYRPGIRKDLARAALEQAMAIRH
jgi:hypothetical protein